MARREVERVNLYFRRKMGILKGHSTDEWKEGYGEWQDRSLMSRAWKWLRRPGKRIPRAQAKRRMVASVRESVDRCASRQGRMTSPSQSISKKEVREASEAHSEQVESDEHEIHSAKPAATSYEGIYLYSYRTQKQHGPYSVQQLQKLVYQGYFTPHDLAIYQGLEQWVTLEQVPNVRFPVVETPADPEAEPEPAAEETLALEEDAPVLPAESAEDAEPESDQHQAETPSKRKLSESAFRIMALACALLVASLYLLDFLNRRMGWNLPLNLGLSGDGAAHTQPIKPNHELANSQDADTGKSATEETEAPENVQPVQPVEPPRTEPEPPKAKVLPVRREVAKTKEVDRPSLDVDESIKATSTAKINDVVLEKLAISGNPSDVFDDNDETYLSTPPLAGSNVHIGYVTLMFNSDYRVKGGELNVTYSVSEPRGGRGFEVYHKDKTRTFKWKTLGSLPQGGNKQTASVKISPDEVIRGMRATYGGRSSFKQYLKVYEISADGWLEAN